MSKYIFSGHDKFDCKIDWISKVLINENINFPIKADETTITKLGLGVNMLKSLNYWLKSFNIYSNNKLTFIGHFIKNYDIFLQDINILWLLHWEITKKRKKNNLYYIFFNEFNLIEFNKQNILEKLKIKLIQENESFSENTLKSDIDVFIKMYTDESSLFYDLNLIRKKDDKYILNISAGNLINEKIFLYFLLDFVENENLEFYTELQNFTNRDFNLIQTLSINENELYKKLFNLSEVGLIKLSESAGLKMIEFNIKDKNEILQKYVSEEIIEIF